MIVFYSLESPIIKISNTSSICNNSCASNCIKPKNKCCSKYKKNGINCKRCPNIFFREAS